MGCDYSSLVKQYFEGKYTNLIETKKKINKKTNQISTLLYQYNELTSDPCETIKIRKDLKRQLEKIEKIIEEFKELKENQERPCFSSSVSFEENVEPLEKPSLFNTEVKSIKSPLKLDTTESILEDPEIMALISKNRNKFMRKLTGL